MTVTSTEKQRLIPLPSFEMFQIVGLTIGIFWIFPRFYAALTSTSIGLLADAVQHVVEVSFAFLIFLSLRAASRANAMLFPHGTGKFEAIANGLLAISLILSAFGIIAFGVFRLVYPQVPEGADTGVILLAIALMINFAIYVWSRPLEKGGKSIIRYWRMAYVIDILMKAATIVCVFLAQYGGVFAHLDAIAALIIGGSMAWLAFKTMSDSIWELSDRALEEEAQLLILRSLAQNIDGFDELKDVRTRRIGRQPTIEIRLGFFDNRSWTYVMRQCALVEETVIKEIAGAEVTVIPSRVDHAPFRDPTGIRKQSHTALSNPIETGRHGESGLSKP